MVLQALTLCINDSKVPYARIRWFRYYTGHVVAIFTSMLRDRYRYVLDGSRDVDIFLGPRGVNPTYSQIAVKPPLGRYSVSHYFIEDFDVGGFFAASQKERDHLTLAVLEATVMDIARKVGADPEPI